MKSLTSILFILLFAKIFAIGQTFCISAPKIIYPQFENSIFAFNQDFQPQNLSPTNLTLSINNSKVTIDSLLIQNQVIADELELLICFELSSAITESDKLFIKNYIKNLAKNNFDKRISYTCIFYTDFQIIVLDKFNNDYSEIDEILNTQFYVKPDLNKMILSPVIDNFIKSSKEKSIILFSKSSPKVDLASFTKFINDNSINLINFNLKNNKINKYVDLSNLTKSSYFNINEFSSTDNLFNSSIYLGLGGKPAKIFWNKPLLFGDYTCDLNNFGESDIVNFHLSQNQIPKLWLKSHNIYFGIIDSGYSQMKTIQIFAKDKDIIITDITSEHPDFSIIDFKPNTKIIANSSYDVQVQYNSKSKNFIHSRINIKTLDNQVYPIIASGGNRPEINNSIELIYPTLTSTLVENEPLDIIWRGTFPNDTFKLDYKNSLDTLWRSITQTATNNEYDWQIPEIKDSLIDLKVSQSSGNLISDKVLQLKGHTKRITDLVWSPNDSLISTASEDGRIFLWNSKTGKLDKTLFQAQSKIISGIDWSYDSRFIAIAAMDTLIKIWNIETDVLEKELKSPIIAEKLKFTLDNKKIIGILINGDIIIWDFEDNSVIRQFSSGSSKITCFALNSTSSIIATGSIDGKVILWDIETGSKIKELYNSFYSINSLTFSPNGNNIAISDIESKIRIFDITSGNNVLTLFDTDSPILDIDWLSNKQFIASTLRNFVRLWSPIDGMTFNTYDQHSKNVYWVSSNHNGTHFSSIDESNIVHIWSPYDFPFERPELQSTILKNLKVLHKNISANLLKLPTIQKGDSLYYFDNNFGKNLSDFDIIIDSCYVKTNVQKLSINNPVSFLNLQTQENISEEIEFIPLDSMQLNTTAFLKSGSKIVSKQIQAFVPIRFFDRKNMNINFGTIEFGDKKDTSIFILQNISPSAFSIDSIKIISAFPNSFNIVKPAIPYSLLPNGGAFYPTIEFVPRKAGINTAVLRLFIKNTIPVDIQLSGLAVAPLVAMNTINDIGQLICDFEKTVKQKVTNIGNSNLKINSIQVLNDTLNEIRIINLSNQDIHPDDSTFVDILIHSKTIGKKKFIFEIATNRQANNALIDTFQIALQKDSVNIFPNFKRVDFYPINDDDKVQTTIKFSNKGNIIPKLSYTYLPKYFHLDSTTFSQSEIIFYITFLGGQKLESYFDSLTFTDDCLNEYKLSLSAYPQPNNAIIEVERNLFFDNIVCESSSTKDLIIKNKGTDTLIINNILLQNVNSNFKIPGITELSVTPGKEYLISINFTSNEEGLFADTLIINSNAYNSNNGISKVTLYAYKGILKYSFSSDTLNFKLLTQNSKDTLQFKFSNEGENPLKLKFLNNNPLFSYSYPELAYLSEKAEISIIAFFEGNEKPGKYIDNFYFEDSCGNTKKIVLVAELTNKINFFDVSLPHPNPTNKNTKIIIRATEPFSYLYRIMDDSGKLILESKDIIDRTGYSKIELDFDKFAIGVYIIEIKTSRGIFTRKIIKLE